MASGHSDTLGGQKEKLTENREYLSDNLEPDDIIEALVGSGLISKRQREVLVNSANPHDMRMELIEMVLHGDQDMYEGFIKELRRDLQNAVVDSLEKGTRTSVNLRQSFAKNKPTLSKNLRIEGSFIACLEKHRVITRKRAERVEAQPSYGDRIDALLRCIERGYDESRLKGLTDALLETDQPHLAALVKSGDTDQIVPPLVQENIARKRHDLAKAIAFEGSSGINAFVRFLFQDGIITGEQRDVINTKQLPFEKAEYVVAILTCRPYSHKNRRVIDSAADWTPTAPSHSIAEAASHDVPDQPLWPFNLIPNFGGKCHPTGDIISGSPDPEDTNDHSGPAHSSPKALYEHRITKGELQRDDYQEFILGKLEDLHNQILDYVPVPPPTKGFFTKLFGGIKPKTQRQKDAAKKCSSTTPLGVYLFGSVGCGKTMLMDIFHDSVHMEKKKRIHFHQFMLDVHQRIHEVEKAHPRQYSSRKSEPYDPILLVAKAISEETWLLCLDEFQITEIEDAMILKRLFQQLWRHGVVTIATSTRKPDDLYKDGLQRKHFMPFIPMLKANCDVYNLDSGIDYRRRALPAAGKQSSANAQCDAKMDTLHEELVSEEKADPFGEYTNGLRQCLKDKAELQNKTLLEELGVETLQFGTFYNKLSLSVDIKTGEDQEMLFQTEEYIRRDATSVKAADLELHELFDPVQGDDKEVTRVLMLGAAGAGKSTSALQVAYDWARGEIWQDKIEFSFLFICREFLSTIETGEKMSLGEMLYRLHGAERPSSFNQDELIHHLLSKQKNIQITLDGLDELAGWRDLVQSTPAVIRRVDQPAPIPVIIYNLIRGNLLPDARVLVTSRPVKAASRKLFQRTIVVLGFSQDSIRRCMEALCGSEKDIFEQIMHHITIKTELHIHCVLPLACVLIGIVLRQAFSEGGSADGSQIIETLTQVFIWIVIFTIHRRSPTPDDRYDLTAGQRGTLGKMAALAASGLFCPETKILFDQKDLSQHGLEDEDLKCGLMEVSRDLSTKVSLRCSHIIRASFFHLALQEMMAAVHCVLTWEEGGMDNLVKYINDNRLRMTVVFISGLLGDASAWDFLQTLNPDVRSDSLAARRTQFIQTLVAKDVLRDLGVIQVITCISEGRLEDAVPRLEDTLGEDSEYGGKELDLQNTPGGLLPHQVADISYFMSKSTALTNLNLSQNSLGDAGARALSEGLRKTAGLRVLDLRLNYIRNDGARALGEALTNHPTLQDLDMVGNRIGPEGARALAAALHHNSVLQTLNVAVNKIRPEGARALAAALHHNSVLQTLDVSGNEIGDEGARALAAAFHHNSSLQTLSLGGNDITDEGGEHLARALRVNKSLGTLGLYGNKLSDEMKAKMTKEFGDRISFSMFS